MKYIISIALMLGFSVNSVLLAQDITAKSSQKSVFLTTTTTQMDEVQLNSTTKKTKNASNNEYIEHPIYPKENNKVMNNNDSSLINGSTTLKNEKGKNEVINKPKNKIN
ncbi:MAG TPA: hypothetical protein PK649_06355 [Vicingus sp.]|nr:hypothetical protein [Flavobacteriales bacterium]MCL4857255.1 hypothetical protein [Flavobacteriales bacterium]HRN41680.1 hypothetical protein [Vicingus sp.]HRP61321.1 hypothetical protein [Vicingus sp.]